MEEMRSMWCETLEEVLQCPVCLDVTPGAKIQCANGHHICRTCKNQLYACPMCKSHFINTRNLAVEHISSKINDIKLSILNPYHILNKRILKNKVCVATQTENICTSVACQTENTLQANIPITRNEQQQVMILSPKVGKGMYPCRIGSCAAELPHGRIIGHLRYHHKNLFYEFNNRCTVFKRNWNLEYVPNQDYDFAFFIKGMGLFFLNMSIRQRGDLISIVRIVNNHIVSKQFTYTLETGNGRNKTCYTGLVKSCRVERRFLSEDCLYVRECNMQRITYKNTFPCNLIIRRKIDDRSAATRDDSTESHEVSVGF